MMWWKDSKFSQNFSQSPNHQCTEGQCKCSDFMMRLALIVAVAWCVCSCSSADESVDVHLTTGVLAKNTTDEEVQVIAPADNIVSYAIIAQPRSSSSYHVQVLASLYGCTATKEVNILACHSLRE
jgi:hypothetical protein